MYSILYNQKGEGLRHEVIGAFVGTSDYATCLCHFPLSRGQKFELTLIYFLVELNRSTVYDVYLNTLVME